MMSLVSTPIVAARVAAPKKAVRKTVTAKASASETAKSQAVAGALALTMLVQPAFAASELGQIADGDKSAAAKDLAASLNAELLAKKKAPAPVKKTKNLAVGLPSVSLPSFSAPSLPSGGASKSAPKAKAAPKAPAEKIEGSGSLGLAMVVLFSPLLAVAGLSVQTLLRVIPQAAEGKDFFPKDTMDF